MASFRSLVESITTPSDSVSAQTGQQNPIVVVLLSSALEGAALRARTWQDAVDVRSSTESPQLSAKSVPDSVRVRTPLEE